METKKGVILLTDEMKTKMPADVKIVHSQGIVNIVDDNGVWMETGDHCIVECTQEALDKWYKECKTFIFGKGSPQIQDFEVHTNTSQP